MGDRLGLRADLYGAIAAAEPFARKRRRLFERGVVTAVMGDQANVRVGFNSAGGALIMEAVPVISGYAPVVGGWVKIDYEAGHSQAPFIMGPSLSDEETVDPSGLAVHGLDVGDPHAAAGYVKVGSYGLPAHALVGSSHVVSGATAGQVLRVTSAASYALGKVTDANVSSLLADRISGDKLVYAARESETIFDKALQSYLTSFGTVDIQSSARNAVLGSANGTPAGVYRQTSWSPDIKAWHLVVGCGWTIPATTHAVKLQITNALNVIFYEAAVEYDAENLRWDFITRKRTSGSLTEISRNTGIDAPTEDGPFLFEFRVYRWSNTVRAMSATLFRSDRSVWSSINHGAGAWSDAVGDAVDVRFKFIFTHNGGTTQWFRLRSFGLSDGIWRS